MLCAFNTVASITPPPLKPKITGITVSDIPLPDGTYIATAQRAATTPPTPFFYLPLQGNITNYGSNTSIPVSNITASTSPQYLALANKVFNGNVNGAFKSISINNTILNNMSNHTIACWVYVNRFGTNNWICSNQIDGSSTMAILSLSNSTTNGGIVKPGSSGYVYYRPRNAPSDNNQLVSSSQINLNTWTHIAVSCTSSIGKLYINGQLNKSITASGVMNISNFPGGVSYIGAWTTARSFDGLISDFRVYSSTLSDADIKDLYDMRVHYTSVTVTGGEATFDNLPINKTYNLYMSTLGNANPDYAGTIQT